MNLTKESGTAPKPYLMTIPEKFAEVVLRGGKKNPNPLIHSNPPTNCPPKLTYLINGQMGASPIRPKDRKSVV